MTTAVENPGSLRVVKLVRDNFDIHLPAWLARHNKIIFGLLYVFGILVTIAQWARRLPSFT